MEKTHLKFMESHPKVKTLLKDRPLGTQVRYGSTLMHFCKAVDITPKDFQNLDKKAARDFVWRYGGSFYFDI